MFKAYFPAALAIALACPSSRVTSHTAASSFFLATLRDFSAFLSWASVRRSWLISSVISLAVLCFMPAMVASRRE